MVHWTLISIVWNHNCNDAYPSHESWTAKYWWSYINKLTIVNYFCMITIIGQIKPWGSSKTYTTHCIKRIKRVLSWSWGQIQLGDKGVCREMICDIAKGSVNRSSSAHCHMHKVGTLAVTLENSITTTQRTLWYSTAMAHFRETSISFFWVCGYNKLNKFNEWNLVFADVSYPWYKAQDCGRSVEPHFQDGAGNVSLPIWL